MFQKLNFDPTFIVIFKLIKIINILILELNFNFAEIIYKNNLKKIKLMSFYFCFVVIRII